MKTPKNYRIVDVDITEFSAKGNGRGRCKNPNGEPWVLSVPFTMPGDRVSAKMLRKRAGVYDCQLVEILQPSPARIAPRCIHFGTCGGCRWQHLPYELQLKNKELFVQRCFGLLVPPGLTIRTILPCDNPWEYRNKMEFSFSANAAGDRFLGLNIDSGRGKVLNLTECHLVHRWQIEILQAVKTWWEESSLGAYRPAKNSGSLRTLMLREGFRTGDRMVMLTVSGNPDFALNRKQIDAYAEAVRQAAQHSQGKLSIFLRIQQIAKGIPTQFYEMHLDGPDTIQEVLHIKHAPESLVDILRFKISPAAFFQPNSLQAERLYSLVLQLADVSKEAVVYDLYCGTGTLGVSFAKYVKKVIGVELSPEAVLDARANAALNGFDNVTIIEGAVGDVLSKAELPPPDLVLVDPPRAGLEPEAIRQLLTFRPSKIVYISCNPASQATNVAELLTGGYKLTTLQPVDQFPQTVHIENIAVLIRKESA